MHKDAAWTAGPGSRLRIGLDSALESVVRKASDVLGVLCDVDHSTMRSVELREGGELCAIILTGFECSSPDCRRFFGKFGYVDLTVGLDMVNRRPEPVCSNQHDLDWMYLKRQPEGLVWVCPKCGSTVPCLEG